MPSQTGIITVRGTTGNTTFYKRKNGFGMRAKGGVDAKRIQNDPAFIRTRENGHEFGRAAAAGKLLRNALNSVLKQVADNQVGNRLASLFNRVIKTDTLNNRGERKVPEGELGFFKGFEFNANSPLSTTLYAAVTAAIDRASGAATVTIPAFVPEKYLATPTGATHYVLTAIGAEVDFDNGTSVHALSSSGEMPISGQEMPPVNFVIDLPPNSTKPLFLALCIEFVQEVNGRFYGLSTGQFNAMSMVAVDKAA
ncbi:hypothetical protein [Chitinophaga deserti]|uniref:hypothetical protein n=1 Tax=Chitinophaga deserti TaxID=2164099 RepID=UPI000D6C758B|nr:hypothetical protein [Chitinophaga deserti]